jgi:hypothetical protein
MCLCICVVAAVAGVAAVITDVGGGVRGGGGGVGVGVVLHMLPFVVVLLLSLLWWQRADPARLGKYEDLPYAIYASAEQRMKALFPEVLRARKGVEAMRILSFA